jgi:hypothetical protein
MVPDFRYLTNWKPGGNIADHVQHASEVEERNYVVQSDWQDQNKPTYPLIAGNHCCNCSMYVETPDCIWKGLQCRYSRLPIPSSVNRKGEDLPKLKNLLISKICLYMGVVDMDGEVNRQHWKDVEYPNSKNLQQSFSLLVKWARNQKRSLLSLVGTVSVAMLLLNT